MKNSGNHNLLIVSILLCVVSPTFAEVKPLSEYPEVTRMWMGVEEGVLRPANYEQFRPDGDAYVAIHANDGQMLKKGEHWATIDPENLELERRTKELEDAKAINKEQDALQEARERHVNKIRELHEMQAQHATMQELRDSGDLDAVFGQRVQKAMAQLKEQIAVLEKQVTDDALQESLKLVQEDYSIQAAQRDLKSKTLEKYSMLVAKEAGKLELGGLIKRELEEGAKERDLVWVGANELIGSISSDDAYEIIVSASGPLLSGIPTDQLLVFFQDPRTGRKIQGVYTRADERDSGKQIQRDFIFRVDEDGIKAARRASGSSNSIHVYRRFDKPYRLVSKKDLVFADPEALERSGWAGIVQKTWPGSKVIQVAPQSIAIEPAR